MEWIRITDPDGVEIAGEHYVEGERTHTSYQDAKRLVLASRAVYADAPASPDDVTDIGAVEWTSIDGIGEESAKDIEAWIEKEGVATVADLLGYDLTRLPHVGEELASVIRRSV